MLRLNTIRLGPFEEIVRQQWRMCQRLHGGIEEAPEAPQGVPLFNLSKVYNLSSRACSQGCKVLQAHLPFACHGKNCFGTSRKMMRRD